MVPLRFAVLTGIAFALMPIDSMALCVSPPDVTSNDYSRQWDDVIRTIQLPEAAGVVRAQTLQEDGFGMIHLDYDAVTLDAGMPPERLFEMIRTNLGLLLVKPELNRRLFAFSPVGSEGTEVWSSDDQTGALLRFTALQFENSLSFENDDFLVSCSDAYSLTLSTVTTESGGLNALSGVRGVGVVINPDGSITLFTKAAHRLTTSPLQVIGGSQGQEILAGNSAIWSELIDRAVQLFPGAIARDRVAFHTTIDGPSSGAGAGEDGIFKLLNEKERASFRNGLRSYTAIAMAPHVEIDLESSASLVEALSQARGNTERQQLAFAAGFTFANAYNSSFNRLLKAHQHELGDSLARVIAPWGGLNITAQEEAIGTTLSSLLKDRPEVVANLGLGATDRARLQLLIAELRRDIEPTRLLVAVLRASLKDLASDAVNQIVNEFEAKLTDIEIDQIQKDLNIDDATLQEILALRETFSDMQAIKMEQLLTLKNIGNVVFTYLLYSGQCLCIPPDCTSLQAICTGYYVYLRFENWQPTWEDLSKSLIDFALPEPYLTVAELAVKAKAFFDALQKIRQFDQIKRVPDALQQLQTSVNIIAGIDWAAATQTTIDAHIRLLTVSPEPVPVLPELCPAAHGDRSALQEDSCALQTAKLSAETELTNIIAAMDTISGTMKLALGEKDGAFLDPVIRKLQEAQFIFVTTIGPSVDGLYAELDLLQVRPRLAPDLDAVTMIAPLLDQKGINLFDFRDRAITLAAINEESLRLATETVRTSIAGHKIATPQLHAQSFVASGSVIVPQAREQTVQIAVPYPFLVDELADLYQPDQNREDILDRLGKTRSPFIFFRQFPPLFYKGIVVLLDSDASFDGLRTAVAKYRSWTVGDPHLQNFGTVFPFLPDAVEALRDTRPDNKAGDLDPCSPKIVIPLPIKVVMNDPDDGGEGSPILDFTRFLSGLELFRPGLIGSASEDLLAAYVTGLEGGSWTNSYRVDETIKSAQPYVERCKMHGVLEPRHNFRERKDEIDGTENLSPEELASAVDVVRKFFRSDAEVTGAYKYKRLRGGSGGNWRWELKVSTPRGVEYWIEVKGLGIRPGNFPASALSYGWHSAESAAPDLRTPAQLAMGRYRTTLYVTLGNEAVTSYQVVDTLTGPALLRYRLKGQGSFGVGDLSDSDLLGLAKDELFVLGQIHRRGFEIWLGEDKTWLNYKGELKDLLPVIVRLARLCCTNQLMDGVSLSPDGLIPRFP